MAWEHSDEAVAGLDDTQAWARPGGAASVGFHLAHLAGSTDRLLTYARGELLSRTQQEALVAEARLDLERPALGRLRTEWRAAFDRALAQLAATPESSLAEPRLVGRARLPSTVLGLLFHAAEHAQRHTGQLVTTAKIVRATRA
jgi:uncharacterized damage-inducible protein DinB